jgi:hypothetical protein
MTIHRIPTQAFTAAFSLTMIQNLRDFEVPKENVSKRLSNMSLYIQPLARLNAEQDKSIKFSLEKENVF